MHQNCDNMMGNENSSGPTSYNSLRHDSGIGKENIHETFDLPRVDTDLSFYSSFSPKRSKCILGEIDTNSEDSGFVETKLQPEATTGKRAFSLLDTMDEEFLEIDCMEEQIKLPTDFSTLISGSLTPSTSTNFEVPSNKKPKSYKSSPALNGERIKYVLQRSSTEPDLIGDFTKTYCLPFISGHHPDLKYIFPTTLASILKGEFDNVLASYKIIDCRFPYEFDGGHVRGALNFYLKDHILQLLSSNPNCNEADRNILIFHCEFSSERGPNMCRFLRNIDRSYNEYPKLQFPEIYLLQGGYKMFHEQCLDLCEPRSYMPMLHPQHASELRFFKGKTKSWNEDRLRPSNRRFKRLGFM